MKFYRKTLESQATRLWRRMLGMIPQDLMEILVCPVCKKSLVQSGDGQSLKCNVCRRAYPVRDNIPILLVDEAVIEPL